jgi:lysophospholipase L1-like esterase
MRMGLGLGMLGGLGGGMEQFTSLVAIGDSFTVGTGASDAAHQWLTIYGAARGVSVAAGTLVNSAITGTVLQNSNDAGGSAKTNNMKDRIVGGILTGANKKQKCIIAGGFNDYRYTGSPSTFNVYRYQADLDASVAVCLGGGYVADDIIIVGPYYMTDTGLITGSQGFNAQTRTRALEYVAAALYVAQKRGTRYADPYTAMLNGGAAALIGGDNIHPNDSGHAVIAACVLAATKLTATADATAPTITSAATASVQEQVAFAWNLTASEAVQWTKTGGADTALFTITTQGLLTMAAKDFEAPADSGANNVYDVQVTATDFAGLTAVQNLAVTVTNRVDTAPFVNDTFTDVNGTAITSHTGETGATWTLQSGYAPAAPNDIQANRVRAPNSGGAYQASGVPAGTNQFAETILTFLESVTSDLNGPAVRMQAAANTMYFARYSVATGGVQLFKIVATTATALGSAVLIPYPGGEDHTLGIDASGTAPATINVYWDGALIITQTDSAITTAGKAGYRGAIAQGVGTGIQIASFRAVDI